MKNLFNLQGKVAVVTGGSRGIGAMIARGFVENGVKTYITARKQEELDATAGELGQYGECIPLASDLSTVEGVTAFADAVKAREGRVDILVNNAGATWGAPIDEFPESGWDKVMDLNVKSLFFLTQQFMPALRAAADQEDPARIINIGSINGLFNPNMTNYSYSASKAAVMHLTKHLAADLAKDNINVNAIAPGLFPSKMTAFALSGHEEEVGETIPRGRIGSPEDAAGTAIYLCARASAWVTGHTVVLDGGSFAAAH
ncbi:glucose 1-dehydrogenase [Aestuariicella hydrocarbonica]|uniref:Glucose 1-dehydrogenase n=1 Tax=Pseudomaricurvus hydrocarbonicus TaxID=1470433 RepID=A0A9E5MLJ6_9GAMM|nr:glucose 1-dehydrogenase [Aestuariicella hydrocarbonica]NHO64010.1 glucose 1-dehydrogenase [Aestuariicella hydrocarbonica]